MTAETEIIEAIKELPLKEALAYLISQNIFDFARDKYAKIKKLIQDKQNEAKYAFPPSKEEAEKLRQFSKDPLYQQILECLPHHRHIDIIRTGLLMDSLYKRSKPDDSERVSKIKEEIVRRPNGSYLIKIANLPTTPFFSTILQYLHELKVQGLSEKQLEDSFDEIVTIWKASSFFVKNEHRLDEIYDFCEKRMQQSKPFLFLLGMEAAAEKVEKAIRNLKRANMFGEYDYEYKIVKSEKGNLLRVEATIFRKL